MELTLPLGCKVKFEDPNALHRFNLIYRFYNSLQKCDLEINNVKEMPLSALY